jgi:hypothetical protein
LGRGGSKRAPRGSPQSRSLKRSPP